MGACVVLLAATPLGLVKPERTALTHPCNRKVSRDVQKSVEKEFTRDHGYKMEEFPDDCPFKAERHIWHFQDAQMQKKRVNGRVNWVCGICGKSFKSEHYLDVHMEKRHMDTATGDVCLADYCEIFDVCDDATTLRFSAETGFKRKKDDKCDEETQKRVQILCDDALNRCFPIKTDSKFLNIHLRRNFCAMMNCEIRKQFADQLYGSPLGIMPLMLGLVIVLAAFFLGVIFCVDYCEDIVAKLVNLRLASTGFLRNFIRLRMRVQRVVGVGRSRQI